VVWQFTEKSERRIGMFIFLDTETTGTGPEDRLCQIAFNCSSLTHEEADFSSIPKKAVCLFD
jgi:DNA polymerase III epsilon subunit-like protein